MDSSGYKFLLSNLTTTSNPERGICMLYRTTNRRSVISIVTNINKQTGVIIILEVKNYLLDDRFHSVNR